MDGLDLVDPDHLLLKLSQGGQLEQEEVEALEKVLVSSLNPGIGRSPSVDDVYAYLTIIGKAKLVNLRQLLERFLEEQDPLNVALVLEVLCLSWGGTEDYLEQVLNFALGAPWDTEDDVRQVALEVLGEYLSAGLAKEVRSKGKDKIVHYRRVLELLLATFDDMQNEQWIRQSAYFALCRAAGKSEEELPPECAPLDLKNKVDHGMLKRLHVLVSELSETSAS